MPVLSLSNVQFNFYARSQSREKGLLVLSCMSVGMSVCPSVSLLTYMERLVCHCTDFHNILYLNIFFFRKSVEKFQVSLKSDKHSEYFTWRHTHTHTHTLYIYIYIYVSLLLRMRNFFPWKPCLLRYIVEKLGRVGQSADNNMVRALCIIDSFSRMKTLIIFNTYCSSAPTIVTRSLYLYCLSCFFLHHTQISPTAQPAAWPMVFGALSRGRAALH